MKKTGIKVMIIILLLAAGIFAVVKVDFYEKKEGIDKWIEEMAADANLTKKESDYKKFPTITEGMKNYSEDMAEKITFKGKEYKYYSAGIEEDVLDEEIINDSEDKVLKADSVRKIKNISEKLALAAKKEGSDVYCLYTCCDIQFDTVGEILQETDLDKCMADVKVKMKEEGRKKDKIYVIRDGVKDYIKERINDMETEKITDNTDGELSNLSFVIEGKGINAALELRFFNNGDICICNYEGEGGRIVLGEKGMQMAKEIIEYAVKNGDGYITDYDEDTMMGNRKPAKTLSYRANCIIFGMGIIAFICILLVIRAGIKKEDLKKKKE